MCRALFGAWNTCWTRADPENPHTLGESPEPPLVSPARGPPTDWGEPAQAHDDGDGFQASPEHLQLIDIHSL
jgi:hypothetical protein